jgi:hypothetical protein
LSEPPRKRLPQHRLRQPLASPARRHNLAIDGIRTGEKDSDTADDLVLLGEGGWENLVHLSSIEIWCETFPTISKLRFRTEGTRATSILQKKRFFLKLKVVVIIHL